MSKSKGRAGKGLIEARLDLSIEGETVPVQFHSPPGQCLGVELVPAWQEITDQLVTHAVAKSAARGERVRCAAGCGACCRQPVPVSLLEAQYLHLVLRRLPAGRQEKIRAAFAHIQQVLAAVGLEREFRAIAQRDKEERRQLARQYFALALPCPFLDNESCSIYEHRPLQCREFLVTSDPRYCAELDASQIRHISHYCTTVPALVELSRESTDEPAGWMLMVYGLEWAAKPRTWRRKPARVWVETFLAKVFGNAQD